MIGNCLFTDRSWCHQTFQPTPTSKLYPPLGLTPSPSPPLLHTHTHARTHTRMHAHAQYNMTPALFLDQPSHFASPPSFLAKNFRPPPIFINFKNVKPSYYMKGVEGNGVRNMRLPHFTRFILE